MPKIKIDDWGIMLAEELRAKRHLKRWNQSQFGKRIGLTQPTISTREKDARFMTLEEAVRVCGVYGCEMKIDKNGVIMQ